ncbi:unnamed protein product [Caenorhabditis angaria]|uniref:Uncharacterized protein n=1 Tax=Caenorhabditis angaria TaxID=860376 RepID=A0A9P1N1X2_9PELO|nr:unnamed protein product [Caenorhabditis angaria]
MANFSTPVYPCTEQENTTTLLTVLSDLSLVLGGLISNMCLHVVFSGRPKLATASFSYIRIIGIFQFMFFLTPFPLKILTDKYQRGSTWIAVNLLPIILSFVHFVISTLCLCFAMRLLLLLNCIRRCRRWNSLSWVAWQKMFCLFPVGTILNMPLCFEYVIYYKACLIHGRMVMMSETHKTEAAKDNHLKADWIRTIPAILYCFSAVCTLTFMIAERCILPKLSSPYAAKHTPLFSNLLPLLLSLIISHSVANIGIVYHVIFYGFDYSEVFDEHRMNMLFAISYSLPFPLMLILSSTFRSHLFHIISNFVQGRPKMRKDSTLRKVTSQITKHMAYSKLEMENSELDNRMYPLKATSMRSMLREDAVYRVKFAIPQQTVQIIEEEPDEVSRWDSDTL